MPAAVRQDWQTPEWIVEKIHKIFPDGFYDPCTEESNPTRAMGYATPTSYTMDPHRPEVPRYWNPPFGSLGPWVKDVVFFSTFGPQLLLVPLRTHTKWYQELMKSGRVLAYCHLAERVKFRGAKAGYREPIALFLLLKHNPEDAWRSWNVQTPFAQEFSPHGYTFCEEVW